MDYSSPSTIRSPFSPRVVGSRRPLGSASKLAGKFGQIEDLPVGDVIYKTPHMVLQSYGAPLPVTVTEALTFSRNEISGRMSCSWCWLVWGRRVLAWPLAGGAPRDLTLPQTDLAHSADLVMLLENGQPMPACIGVSPEGLVRYWPSVSQAGVFAETACELAGQECCELQRVDSNSVVLCTTSRTLLMLTTEERGTVSVRVLRGAGGLLGGLSRRVASLLFPSTPPSDAKLVGVVVFPRDPASSEPLDAVPWLALLSADATLQLWANDAMHTHALQPLMQAPTGESGAEVVVCAAAALGPHTLLLLLCAVSRYARATISLEDPTTPRVTSLTGVAGAAGGAGGARHMKLLLLQSTQLLYTSTTLTLLHRGELDLSSEGDSVVCASSAGNVAVLLSHKHGVLRLTPGKSVPAESGAEGAGGGVRGYDASLPVFEIDPEQLEATDAMGKLKLAFLHHIRGSVVAARAELAQLVTAGGSAPELAQLVLVVAEQLLDDMPAGDPRWPASSVSAGSGAAGVALGASCGLQPQQQLRDKRRVLRLLADLLQHQPAGVVPNEVWGGLCALDELAALALAMRRLQLMPQYAADLACAVMHASAGPWVSAAEAAALAGGRLAPADVCYRHATKAYKALLSPRLNDASIIEQCVRAARGARDAWPAPPRHRADFLPELVQAVNRIILSCGPADSAGDGVTRSTRLEQALSAALLLLEDGPRPDTSSTTKAFLDIGERERAALVAEKFADLELLVRLCIEAGDLDRLYAYVDKFGDQGMADLAARGILSARGSVQAQAARTAPPCILSRLESSPGLLAVSLLHQRPAAAADRLLQVERRTLEQTQVTASLAKLCLLACDDAPRAAAPRAPAPRAALLAAAEAALLLCEQQAALPRHRRAGRVLSAEEIVQVYLDSEPADLTEYDYKKALDVTSLVEDEDLRNHLRVTVFAASILRDSWDERVEALENYMFCKLLQLLLVMAADLSVLPPREQLEQHPSLSSLARDPHFGFLLRHAYHTVQQDDAME